MKKFFLVLLIGTVLQSAFSQDSGVDGESEASLDFVVTAGRTPEAANKVSGQVTVITAADIAESGASSIVEVLETVPGIRIAKDRTGLNPDISMRGISSDVGRGKVLVIVDGMRLNAVQERVITNWDTINLSEIERIEVLDGGASVQYGDNAQAGVINIITRKSGAARTDIAVSAGSFFQNEQRFSHHQPTGWGGFTISGGHHGTRGYQKNNAGDSENGELRGIFDINDAMSLQANVGFAVKNGVSAEGLTKAQFDDDPTQNPGSVSGGGLSISTLIAGMGYTWALNDTLSLDAPVSYNFTDTKYYYGGSSKSVLGIASHMLGFRPKITAELEPADMRLRFTGGVDTLFAFGEVKTSYEVVQETNPIVQTVSEITLGPWALVNFEPFSFLSLNAGLRYDTAFIKSHMDSWSGIITHPSYGAISMSYASGDASTDFDAFVYEAGLTVNPFDFLKVYAKYGTQFRYPYIDNIITVPIVPGGTLAVDSGVKAEKGWTAEGGIGINIKGIARLDANFYYLRIDNEIFSVILPSLGTWITENREPIDRIGTNIGLQLTPVKQVSLDFDYGFVNAEFSEGPFEGKFVPLVAKHTLSAALMLHTSFGLSLGPDVVYKSEMYQELDAANEQPVIDPSFIWNFQARYVINRFKGELAVMLTVHNLADTKYTSFAVYGGPSYGSLYYVDNNMGRSVNVSVQYRF